LFISASGWAILSAGLRENTTISEITINFCRLNDEGVVSLAPAIGYNVRTLDLSNNEIMDRGAWEIGKMLQKHAEWRDHKVWQSGLRGETGSTTCEKGIIELSLANNDLGDKGSANICSSLFQDVWMCSLDLRMNQMETEGLKEVSSLLDTNKSILLVDTRENIDKPNFLFTRKIIHKLRRNVNIYRNRAGPKYNEKYERRLLELYGELRAEYITNVTQSAIEISNDVTIQLDNSPPKSLSRGRRRLAGSSIPRQHRDHSSCDHCIGVERELSNATSKVATLVHENTLLRKKMSSRSSRLSGTMVTDKENADAVILNRIEGVMTDIKKMMRGTKPKNKV
jgi:hypothetical protein